MNNHKPETTLQDDLNPMSLIKNEFKPFIIALISLFVLLFIALLLFKQTASA
jgi:hypothetical protein